MSLPHVQQNKRNMMKMGAKERKWAQGAVNQRKTAEKKKRSNGHESSMAQSINT